MGARELNIGNVIRVPSGDLWIVTEVDDRVVQAVSFDSENCSAVQLLEDEQRAYTCQCGDHPDFAGEPQEDCEDCHGTGRYTKLIRGWKHSKVLAPTVEAFILKGVKRAFQID